MGAECQNVFYFMNWSWDLGCSCHNTTPYTRVRGDAIEIRISVCRKNSSSAVSGWVASMTGNAGCPSFAAADNRVIGFGIDLLLRESSWAGTESLTLSRCSKREQHDYI